MIDLPDGLLTRFDDDERVAVSRTVAGLVAAYTEQYRRERRAFDKDEGDDGVTYAWNLRQHGWARAHEYLEDEPAADLHTRGLTHSVRVGPLTIRPYRLGARTPDDIHHERLDPSSQVKQFVGLDNAAKAQLTLDIREAITVAEVDPALRYAPDQLVMATYGNPTSGMESIFLGAPLEKMYEGSYWRWVLQVAAGPGPDDGEQRVPSSEPDGPQPYDAGEEPNLPMTRRDDDRRRETSE